MSKVHAVYPGSFDPLHNGHLDVIERASKVFNVVTIAVLNNSQKKNTMFTPKERIKIINRACTHLDNVEVESFEGLLVKYVQKKKAQVIVKGLRTIADYEYEQLMAHINRYLLPDVETVFLLTDPRWSFVSSTRIKEIARYDADISGLIPAVTQLALLEKLDSQN